MEHNNYNYSNIDVPLYWFIIRLSAYISTAKEYALISEMHLIKSVLFNAAIIFIESCS